VGTEARRVETEDANDARLESFRLREIPERLLSRRQVSMHFEHGKEKLGLGCPTTQPYEKFGVRPRIANHKHG